MREMRHIAQLFTASSDFDEQWILLKAYLNTLHSMTDNDAQAKHTFIGSELMNFILVLRNIIHHQPAKWHFGKHDVYPTSLSIKIEQGKSQVNTTLSLVIQKDTLQGVQLQERLAKVSKRQLEVLKKSLELISDHAIIVDGLIKQAQEYVEQYCKDSKQYTESRDLQPRGYRLLKRVEE